MSTSCPIGIGQDSPISASKNITGTWNVVGLSGVGLDSDTRGVLDTEQVVHDLEPLLPLGEINAADVHDALELTLRVVSQKGEDRDDSGGCSVECQFILENGELLDEFWEGLDEV